ncbi:MarR family winged helix-turn-helix transcriptional regulator [Clostridium mediterraneense]|uniref:MarR family winged helix-turn-helix transcriptional regulator n=1 Tax=Clostridium mediterraneense TaxID=1805472 RepID=UPI000A00E564|nr:MarR family transcriptional regulator [Clostridium mediterraneense]
MDEKIDDELYREFHKTMKCHFRCSQKILEKEGLYAGQPPLLFALKHEDGQRQKDIAEKLNIQPATVNVMAKRLEKGGFIEKREDSEDKRVSRLYLTDKGRKTCENAKLAMLSVNKELFDILTNEEKENFKNILKKINENLHSCNLKK